MARSGRPTKLNPQFSALIIEVMLTGATHKDACETAGIGESTLYRWLEQGKSNLKRHKIYKDFRDDYKKAEAHMRNLALGSVRQAIKGVRGAEGTPGVAPDWRAGAWYLERRHGFNKSGRAAAQLRPAGPEGETQDARLVRGLEELYEEARSYNQPDKAANILVTLNEVKKALGEEEDSTPETKAEVIAALANVPVELLNAAIAAKEEEDG